MMTVHIADDATELERLRVENAECLTLLAETHRLITEQNRVIQASHAAMLCASETHRSLDTPSLRMMRAAVAMIEGHVPPQAAVTTQGDATVTCCRCRVDVPVSALSNPTRCPDERCPLKPKPGSAA